MSVQAHCDILIQDDEVVKAPLPPAFVGGLAEALQEVVWNWLHEHAPNDLQEVTWFAGEFDRYAREAEAREGRVPADLAKQTGIVLAQPGADLPPLRVKPGLASQPFDYFCKPFARPIGELWAIK